MHLCLYMEIPLLCPASKQSSVMIFPIYQGNNLQPQLESYTSGSWETVTSAWRCCGREPPMLFKGLDTSLPSAKTQNKEATGGIEMWVAEREAMEGRGKWERQNFFLKAKNGGLQSLPQGGGGRVQKLPYGVWIAF